MILYRITKERSHRRYGTDDFYVDKHEVVITANKGRVTQCVEAAKRENRVYRPDDSRPFNYKFHCLVETLEVPDDAQFKFLKKVEFPS